MGRTCRDRRAAEGDVAVIWSSSLGALHLLSGETLRCWGPDARGGEGFPTGQPHSPQTQLALRVKSTPAIRWIVTGWPRLSCTEHGGDTQRLCLKTHAAQDSEGL